MNEELTARFNALEEAKKESFIILVEELMGVYESESGGGIVMCDKIGLGMAELNAVGNPLVIDGLLQAAGVIGQRISSCDMSNVQ